ncbi:hypothetical protein [Noviherbaspirillum soli]|uniref:hypothetical protein n=1 Tax=Noviherbaspirillum soli TaxID=1064518 RepID=UPI00188B9F2A|nr:hypothetical protein [Noviherbaspirillum soli]
MQDFHSDRGGRLKDRMLLGRTAPIADEVRTKRRVILDKAAAGVALAVLLAVNHLTIRRQARQGWRRDRCRPD